MRIAARVANRAASHDVTLDTAGRTQSLAVAAKAKGGGSAVRAGPPVRREPWPDAPNAAPIVQ